MIETLALHHIGIAVTSIEAQRPMYEQLLGLTFEGIETVADQGVKVAFFKVGTDEAGVRVELLEPTSEDSPIAKHLQRRGPGLHHLAYAVKDIEASLESLKAKGVRLIDETPRIGAHGMKIAFLHPKSTEGVLIELCQPQE